MKKFAALFFAIVISVSISASPLFAEMDKMSGMKGDMMTEKKAEHHNMMQNMMSMMKEMMGMMKDMQHMPTPEQKNRLDEMMKTMDSMMKMHQEMMKQKEEKK